jgi:hypothetical protein
MIPNDDASPWSLIPVTGWRSVGLVRHDAVAREALASRLKAMPGWQLVFACASAQEVLAELEHNAPSVLLVDLGLPDGEALEVLRQAGRCWPGCVAMAICDDAAAVGSLRLPEVQACRPAWTSTPSGRDPALTSLPARAPAMVSCWND